MDIQTREGLSMPYEDQMPNVSIIILNWNGREDTIECLGSLSHLDYPNHQVVVVDNGSDDDSAAAISAAFPEVVLIENQFNLGFSEGNNRGIEYALERGAEYLLILNNDTSIDDRDFLGRLVAFAEHNEGAGLVSPKILYYRSDRIWFAGGRVSYLSGFSRHIAKGKLDQDFAAHKPYPVGYVSGCCMLASRRLLERIGLFDPVYFLYYEDTDLSFRAKRAGFTNYVVPTASIYHKKSSTAGIRGENLLSDRQAYYFSRNAVIFARKQLTGWRKWVFLFSQFAVRFPYNLFLLSRLAGVWRYLKGMIDGIRIELDRQDLQGQ